MFNIHQSIEKESKTILQYPSEKKSIINPNNDSPNLFKHNLKMRLMNYKLVQELEKNPLNLYK